MFGFYVCPNPSFNSNSCDGSGAICPENCAECKTETHLGVTRIGPSEGRFHGTLVILQYIAENIGCGEVLFPGVCHPRTCTVCTNNTYLHANECKDRCPDGGLAECMAFSLV